MDAAKDLTELVEIDPATVDLVKSPANGFQILVMKALAPESEVTEPPEPPADEASKETGVPDLNEDKTPETPESQVEPVVEKSAAELVDEAVAKAVQNLEETVIKGLRDEMAALKSTPIPGGPAVTSITSPSEGQRAQQLAKAAYHERLAGQINNRELARYHEEKAAEARKAAQA